MQNLKQLIKDFRELKEKSTPANYWYEYHYEAQIRGPYNRWMQFTNETELRNPDGRVLRASAIDDIRFISYAANNITKLLDAVEILVEGLEFYADGAGLDLVDEGRDYLSNYVAYENDFRRDTPTHLDKPVGEYAKQALQLAEEKVRL